MDNHEVWRARVAEWRASGRGVADFSRGKGFTASGLRYWVKRLEAEESSRSSNPVRIARVVRPQKESTERRGGPGARAPLATTESSSERFIVEMGAMRVEVPATFDVSRLEAVLVAVGRASRGGAA